MICCVVLLKLLLIAATTAATDAANRLNVAYEWNQMDFAYRTPSDRQQAIEAGTYSMANVIPVGLEVHERRLFVTLPRWKTGVPASLAYIDLNDNSRSPLLHPYPSWGAHSVSASADDNSTASEIISPFRVRADRCNRLWVLDTGTVDILGDRPVQLAPAQLLVYDLHNDNLLRRYTLPAAQRKHDSFFANIAVEVGTGDDCANAYAYLADLGSPGLVVYSWRLQDSWRVHHHYFHPDPLAGDYNVAGTRFQWDDGLFGVALSAESEPSDERRLYFHALSSTMEFSVRTQLLRNRTSATDTAAAFTEYRQHGSRGERGQSGAAFMADGVVFYTMPNRNAVTCWRASETGNITASTLGVVLESDVEMVFPNDVKVDANGTLWVLSDNLQRFTYGQLDANAVNYRILRGTVREAIAGTICEQPMQQRPDAEHDHSGHVHEHVHPTGDDVQRTRARPPAGRPNAAHRDAHLSAVVLLVGVFAKLVCL